MSILSAFVSGYNSKPDCNPPNRLRRAGRFAERRAGHQISERHVNRSTKNVQEKAAQNDGHQYSENARQPSVRFGWRR